MEYPNGVTSAEHIAHDMRTGRFPSERSSIEQFLSEREAEAPRVVGVSRLGDNDKAIVFSFNRPISDDELRRLHDALREQGHGG